MNRLIFISLFAFAFSLAASERLNVLFIMTDDLNCNIGAYGHPLVQTPNIDRLADQGLLFENAHNNYPSCAQSRASFMTGLYPEQSGVTKLHHMFRDYVPDAVTMSQHFMNHGYTAARVGKLYHYANPHSIGTHGHDDKLSWDTRVNPAGIDIEIEDEIHRLSGSRPLGGMISWLAVDSEDEEHTDGIVATESIKLLEKYAGSGKPFFLGVGFYKPHTPFVAPTKYFEMYDPADVEVPRIPDGYFETIPEPAKRSVTVFPEQVAMTEKEKRTAIHAYYATITFMDAQIGRVLDSLEELGLADDTIVLFSSDHGFHMGEHLHFQKKTLFEDSSRVPLILSAPDMSSKGKCTHAIVEMIDFYRTLSELAGLPEPPAYVQGKSMAHLLDSPEAMHRESALIMLNQDYSIRTKRYRYTYWPDAEGLKVELYDHLNDPAEMVNLAGNSNYADVEKELHAMWRQRVTEASTPVEGLELTPPAEDDWGLSIDEMNRRYQAGEM